MIVFWTFFHVHFEVKCSGAHCVVEIELGKKNIYIHGYKTTIEIFASSIPTKESVTHNSFLGQLSNWWWFRITLLVGDSEFYVPSSRLLNMLVV